MKNRIIESMFQARIFASALLLAFAALGLAQDPPDPDRLPDRVGNDIKKSVADEIAKFHTPKVAGMPASDYPGCSEKPPAKHRVPAAPGETPAGCDRGGLA